MYKKIVLSLFFALTGIICIDLYANLFAMDFCYYIQSLFMLGLGIVIYPLDFRFRYKADFMFLPIIVVALLNLINLFLIKDFSFEINCINVFSGFSGVFLSLLKNKIN